MAKEKRCTSTTENSTRQGYWVITSLFILFQIPMLALELPFVELYKCNISTCNPITCKPTIFPFLLNCVSLALVGPLGSCQKVLANRIRERRNHVMMKVEYSLVTWYKCTLTIAFVQTNVCGRRLYSYLWAYSRFSFLKHLSVVETAIHGDHLFTHCEQLSTSWFMFICKQCIKGPTDGFQNCNTNQIWIFDGYPKLK